MAVFLALAVVLPTALALPPNFQQALPKGHPGGRINGDDVRCWDLAQDTELPERCDHFLGSPKAQRVVDLNAYSARGFSQHGADGLLWAAFETLGATDKYYVEFGSQRGCITNTRWLRERCGWRGVLLDGRRENASIGLSKAVIGAHNAVEIFRSHGVPEAFDLLSVDIDDQDWHVWRALAAAYRPRVVVIEAVYNYPDDLVSPLVVEDAARASHFGDGFDCGGRQVATHSATARAMERLGAALNYTLVHAGLPDMYFVRNDALAAVAPRAFAHQGEDTLGLMRKPEYLVPLPADCLAKVHAMGFRGAAHLLQATKSKG